MDPIKKQQILTNCNALNTAQLIALIDTGPITIEELSAAGLAKEKVTALQLQFLYTLPFEQLVAAIESNKISLEALLDTGLDEDKAKDLILKFCNNLKAEKIVSLVKSEIVSLREFKDAGLKDSLYNAALEIISKPDPVSDRANKLKEILNGTAAAYEIRAGINNQIYTFDDLQAAGLASSTLESLKHFCEKSNQTVFYEIKNLPAMQKDRMDLLFIGMPGSGKSTMLAGLSMAADQMGMRIPETNNNAGSKYQNKLIFDLGAGVLPEGTLSGSYNYIPLAFKNGENGNKHPFNIIEVPGENYVKMDEDGEANEFLNYLETTSNKKILIFVIDSIKRGRQGLVYVNILNMLKSRGVLAKTDAIYLIVNKFDVIKANDYKNDNRKEEVIAYDFLKDQYLGLINNCIDAREESNQKFKIKILPYSIGSISNVSILNTFHQRYSTTVLDHLMFDSFVVSGGRWTEKFN